MRLASAVEKEDDDIALCMWIGPRFPDISRVVTNGIARDGETQVEMLPREIEMYRKRLQKLLDHDEKVE